MQFLSLCTNFACNLPNITADDFSWGTNVDDLKGKTLKSKKPWLLVLFVISGYDAHFNSKLRRNYRR